RRIFGAYELATEPQSHRDKETRRQGDKGTRRKVEKRLVSLSPCLPVSLSLLASVSLWLCVIDTARVMTNRIDGGMIRSQINISNLGFRLRGEIMKRTLLSMATVLFCLCAIRASAQDDSKTIKSFYSKSDFAVTADPNSGEWKKIKGVVATNGPLGDLTPGH